MNMILHYPVRAFANVVVPLVGLFCVVWVGGSFTVAAPQQQEEEVDYFQKWLTEDVVYIITRDEKAVFESLTTEAEKEQFIEQFWFRRDPDPRTSVNEFKEEHYRRIAYANENYFSALPGWRTDRGRVFIIHGPPDEIESKTAGETYHRPVHEGGGSTAVFPFEIWRYRHLDGLGSDIEVEFVDPTMTGEFRLARHMDEKDAFLFIPGLGPTDAERMGLAEKKDRPFFSPDKREDYPLMYRRQRDNPFQHYETINFIQRPPQLKYSDLKQVVEVDISFEEALPFEIRQDYFRLAEDQVLVPITLELENRHLSFQDEGGRHQARVAIYGVVTSITNRIIAEFEDDLAVNFPAESFERGLKGRSLYQKILRLDRKVRYRLDLVVKDLKSGRVGVVRRAIAPPPSRPDELQASGLVLSRFIRELEEPPRGNVMFVLGDVWIHPSVGRSFSADDDLGLYLQVYDVGLDQTGLGPELEVRYRVDQGSSTLWELIDDKGESIQYASGDRVVLIQGVPPMELGPGNYSVAVTVRDRIRDREVVVNESFRIE
jgi:GWxTD domain-containing protein